MPFPSKIEIQKDLQFKKFCAYGFFKNLRLFEPFLILFFLDNGLTFLQIGVIYSVREIARNVLEVPAGVLSDSLGRKKTMIFSFVLYILSFVIFYLSGTFILFILAMLFYAFGDAFRTGTHKAMIFDYLKINGREDQKTDYYGFTRSYSQLGSAASSILGGIFVFYSGNFRDIFIFTTIPYIFNLILISSYPSSLDGLRSTFRGQHITKNFKHILKGFYESFRKPEMLKAVANLSIHTGYFRAIKDYLQPVLQMLVYSIPIFLWYDNKQRTALIVGLVYFLLYLLTSFASRNSGKFKAMFPDFKKPLNYTLVAGLVLGILSGLCYVYDFIVLSVVFFALIYLVENLRKPIGIANVADGSNKDALATVLSAESQFHSLLAAIFAPVVGFLADYAGLGEAIIIVSFLLLLSVPFFLEKKESEKVE